MMTQNYINDVMESMGWKDGSFIPVANNENRKLMELVSKLSKEKSEKTIKDEYSENQLRKLKAHVTNTDQEINQNLKLLVVHRSQLDSEEHFLKVALNDESMFTKQITEIDKTQLDLNRQNERTRNEIEKINKNLGSLAEKIQWAKTALNEFRLAMERGEAANQLIEKYCKIDSSKAEVLEAKRKIIQAQINKQRAILVNDYEEQKSLEQVLERTAQLYRQAHIERRQMVSTWKEAVNQMNQREKNITESEQELDVAKHDSTIKSSQLNEQIGFLEQQIQNNKDSEQAISELNVLISKLRGKHTTLIDIIALKNNEFVTLKKTVHNISNLLNAQRQKNRQNLTDIKDKEILLEKEKIIYDDLLKKEETFKSRNMSAQERLRQLDIMMETEEKNIKLLQVEVTRLSGALFRTQQQLSEFQNEEKILTMEADALESGVQSIKNGFKGQEKELMRQTEMAYNVEFSMQELERRINNMKGTGDDKVLEREAKIIHLEEIYKKKTENQNILDMQLSEIEDNMKKMTITLNNDGIELEKITNRLKERLMNADGGEKDVKKFTLITQERLVEQSILKMRANQMEKQIKKHNDKSYNLEKHKIALEMAMNERLVDIKAQKDIICMKRKHLMDERSQLKADIGDRLIKIEALKKRYFGTMELLGKNDDGTLITATQIKIKTAQEKYILLKDGNVLNEKVLQAEDDIKAMENTLRIMNYSNDNYRKSFDTLDDKSPQLKEFNDLQEQYCRGLQRLKNSRSSMIMKSEQLGEMTRQKEDLEKIIEEITRMRLDSNDVLLKVHKELLDQKVKLQRAERELKAAMKAAKIKVNDADYMATFEKDLTLKEIEDRNTSALQQLADLVDNNDEIGPSISKYLFERGLNMPQQVQRTKSQTSWRSNLSGRTGSDYSIQVVSASSSKVSCSSQSSTSSSTKISMKTATTPSVIMIGFPGTIRSNVTSRSSSSVKRKKN